MHLAARARVFTALSRKGEEATARAAIGFSAIEKPLWQTRARACARLGNPESGRFRGIPIRKFAMHFNRVT